MELPHACNIELPFLLNIMIISMKRFFINENGKRMRFDIGSVELVTVDGTRIPYGSVF